jgi:hypothetical protein
VRVDVGQEMQVPLHKHLKILAPSELELAAARLDARPHFMGEGDSLGTCGLAHAQVLQMIESVLTHFR